MEIEKICRTCLGLSGPLMSLYDGTEGGAGCIADMLRSFSKTKPRVSDNLPERVCLICISEINRCYSFKLKCENSDRTLRQLLPDALPEEPETVSSPPKVERKHKCVQTSPQTEEEPKETVSREMQTWPVATVDQEMQTDLATEAETVVATPSKRRKRHLVEDNADKEPSMELVKVGEGEALPKFVRLTRKRVAAQAALEPPSLQEEFVLELRNVEQTREENGQENCFVQIETQFPAETEQTEMEVQHDDIEEFYELSQDQADYEGVEGQEEEYEEVIYTENVTEEEAGPAVFNYTVYSNENGETEIETKSSAIQTARHVLKESPKKQHAIKVELQCPDCIQTFVCEKNLRRHLIRRHGWTADKCDERMKHAERKVMVPGGDADVHTVDENMLSKEEHEALLQQLQDDDEELEQRKLPQAAVAASPASKRESAEAEAPPPDVAGQLRFFCETCKAGFAQRKSLTYHRKMNSCWVKSFKCDECDRVFISEATLEEHKATHLCEESCSDCYEVFATKEELSQHMIVAHKRSTRNQCTICKKVFTMLSSLKDHMRVHSGEKPFECTLCQKSFSQSANLRQHMQRHAQEKRFKCEECNKSYVTKAELFSHRRSHTGDQPFKCEFCSTGFTTASSLTKHKRKHTGERPYACDICPMRFAALNVLKNHRRTHTGEKPFKCVFCDKGFTQKGDCQIHQRTHTGERKHACHCGERFTHLATLRSHKKTHQKDKERSEGALIMRRAASGGLVEYEDENYDTAKSAEAMHITVLAEEDEDEIVVVETSAEFEEQKILQMS